jgi:uncharacterized membrane protein required for colicin V production
MNLLETLKAMNVADYIILGFVLWGAAKGYRRGLMRCFLILFCWVGALVAAYLLSPWGVAWTDQRIGLIESLTAIVREKLPVEAVVGSGIFQALSLPGFDLSALEFYAQEVLAGSPANGEGLVEVLSRQGGTLLAYGLVFVVLVVGAFLVLRLVTSILFRGFRGTVLGFINRLAGMLFGAGVNIVVAASVVGLLTPWLVLGSWEQGGFLFTAAEYLSESTIAPYFTYLFIWVVAALAGMPL